MAYFSSDTGLDKRLFQISQNVINIFNADRKAEQICADARGFKLIVAELTVCPVSYTHLDVYKRQE